MTLDKIAELVKQATVWVNWFVRRQNDQTFAEPAPPIPSVPTAKPPIIVQEPRKYLDLMIAAITDFEGGINDLNHRNNNPGNLRKWPSQIGTNKGFAVFRSWEDGLSALRQLLTLAAMGKSKHYRPTMNLIEFFETYAPGNDGNHPITYAKFVARRLGVDISWEIKNLV